MPGVTLETALTWGIVYAGAVLVAAWLANLVGLPWAFFLLFVTAKFAMALAVVLLFGNLVDHPAARAVAAAIPFTTNLWYGGFDLFAFDEAFMTPRLLSQALVLFACHAALLRRPRRALGLVVAALALHPVLSFGPAACLVYMAVDGLVPRRVLFALVACAFIVLVAVACIPNLAGPLFGSMDGPWRDFVLKRTPQIVIERWPHHDLANAAVALSILMVCVSRAPAERRPLSESLVVLGVAAVVFSFLGSSRSLTLILQGQPSRALWFTGLMAIPLGANLVVDLVSRSPRGGLATFGLVLVTWALADGALFSPFWVTCAPLVGGVAAIWYRGPYRCPRVDDWAFVTALTVLLVVPILHVAAACAVAATHTGYWRMLPPFLLLSRLVIAGGALVPIGMFASTARLVPASAAIGAALLVHGAVAMGPWVAHGDFYASSAAARQDATFVLEQLAARRTERPLTVYWPLRPDVLWFEARVACYFHLAQTSGCVFSRGNACEGARRCGLVKPFEIPLLEQSGALDGPEAFIFDVFAPYDRTGRPTMMKPLGCRPPGAPRNFPAETAPAPCRSHCSRIRHG